MMWLCWLILWILFCRVNLWWVVFILCLGELFSLLKNIWVMMMVLKFMCDWKLLRWSVVLVILIWFIWVCYWLVLLVWCMDCCWYLMWRIWRCRCLIWWSLWRVWVMCCWWCWWVWWLCLWCLWVMVIFSVVLIVRWCGLMFCWSVFFFVMVKLKLGLWVMSSSSIYEFLF